MCERNFLRERNLVSETQADLGLTAVLSRQVLDVLFNDFPDKYEEYLAAQNQKRELAYKYKPTNSKLAANFTIGGGAGGQNLVVEKKPFDRRLRAVKAAAKWNVLFNKERVDERYHCLDLQSFIVHVPRRPTVLAEPLHEPYPVALIPGQYSSFVKTYR